MYVCMYGIPDVTTRGFILMPSQSLISLVQLASREQGQTMRDLHASFLAKAHSTAIEVRVLPRPICKHRIALSHRIVNTHSTTMTKE